MNILLAEDEILAAERLQTLVEECDPDFHIVEQVDSVEAVVHFFNSGKTVDLLLLDIQLADGKSFEIFEKIKINIPIIFTTAYDQYAIQAFKFHSIDYLLKPIQPDDLQHALTKFKRLTSRRGFQDEELELLKSILSHHRQGVYRERFIIKAGNKLQFKHASEAAYFFADGKLVFIVTKKDNRKYNIDINLEELERTLDPQRFFRISRKFIVSIDSILEVKGLISTRLEVKLQQPCEHELTISRERSQEFKKWLDQ